MIVCSKCGKEKNRRAPKSRICLECATNWHRNYMVGYRLRNPGFEAAREARRKLNPEYVASERKRGREYWRKLRHEAIMNYGGYECNCCGETEPKFLTMDHVNNDGAAHRKQIGNRGAGLFKWLKDNDYPEGFQVLCMNCNHGKALNSGICPHHEGSTTRASARTAKRLEMESIPFAF